MNGKERRRSKRNREVYLLCGLYVSLKNHQSTNRVSTPFHCQIYPGKFQQCVSMFNSLTINNQAYGLDSSFAFDFCAKITDLFSQNPTVAPAGCSFVFDDVLPEQRRQGY